MAARVARPLIVLFLTTLAVAVFAAHTTPSAPTTQAGSKMMPVMSSAVSASNPAPHSPGMPDDCVIDHMSARCISTVARYSPAVALTPLLLGAVLAFSLTPALRRTSRSRQHLANDTDVGAPDIYHLAVLRI